MSLSVFENQNHAKQIVFSSKIVNKSQSIFWSLHFSKSDSGTFYFKAYFIFVSLFHFLVLVEGPREEPGLAGGIIYPL